MKTKENCDSIHTTLLYILVELKGETKDRYYAHTSGIWILLFIIWPAYHNCVIIADIPQA